MRLSFHEKRVDAEISDGDVSVHDDVAARLKCKRQARGRGLTPTREMS